MALEVRLPAFEGPLDLLLHLIEKNQLNIYDIPIFEVTKQYLEYLRQMNEMNMEIASEFIVMAATLISIKARMLLPAAQKKEDEEEDPREALIARLLEYKKYKQAAAFLRENQTGDSELILYRKPEDIQGERPVPTLEELLDGVTLQELYSIYTKLMRGKRDSVDTVRAQFNSVEKDEYTIEEKIESLMKTMELLEEVSFYSLREKSRSKVETITYFMAMLELSRMNRVVLRQDGIFSDIIMVMRREEVEDGRVES